MSFPTFQPQAINYALLGCAGICVTIGTALCWAHTGSVTVDSNAQKAANYYIVGFFYVWLTAVAIVYYRYKVSRYAASALYLLLGGLVFELVTRNEILSYAYCNMWRIYTSDLTRLAVSPTSNQDTAVKSILAGVIVGHLGILLSVLGASLHQNQNFSLRGTYLTMLAWCFAVPGVISLFTSNSATLQSVNSNQNVYFSAWLIIDTAIGILLVQSAGMLFDVHELVAAGVVIAGTHGAFLLGDMFTLLYQRSLSSEYDGDAPKIKAGGVLCALSVVLSFIGGVSYFQKRHVFYYTQVQKN